MEFPLNFEINPIRKHWNADDSKIFYAIVDVIDVLVKPSNPKKYWEKLKTETDLREIQSLYISVEFNSLKKNRGQNEQVDCADIENILRIIQSIPSDRVEPFKTWLARAGSRKPEVSSSESTPDTVFASTSSAIDKALKILEEVSADQIFSALEGDFEKRETANKHAKEIVANARRSINKHLKK